MNTEDRGKTMQQGTGAWLMGRDGRSAVLEAVSASGDLRGPLLEMTVTQRFRNPFATNLEAVYRFPLPWGAVLLGVEVSLNGQRMTGAVVERRQAEARYETALAEGDSAILLEHNHDGSYGLNLGNLLAGETCAVTLRYAQVLRFEQAGLRLVIPTLIAPRYGDPVRDGGLAPHQTLGFDTLAAYPFEVSVRLHGELARARVASPSHPIAVAFEAAGGDRVLAVSLARQGALDRDFVLVVDRLACQSLAVMAGDTLGEPGAGQAVVLASFLPRLPAQAGGQAIKVLVDCSGSMAGDSIAAARRALHAALAQLGPEDHFSLSRFGSSVEHRARGLWPVTEASRLAAQRWVGELEADLGGTEMEAALVSTCALPHEGDTDLLLVTDGEIEGIDRLVETARRSGHRVFAVGIGSSPAEGHLRRLAEATEGACDFVAPGEAVEPALLRMFARLRSPRLGGLRLIWPQDPLWESPLARAVFDGDTVSCFARFREPPTGSARLLGVPAGTKEPVEVARVELGGSGDAAGQAPLEPGDAPARLAAMAQFHALAQAGGDTAAAPAVALALTYQLVTDRTHFLLVKARAEGERPVDMPELHHVAQMVPAGWGGTGSVLAGPATADAPIGFRRLPHARVEDPGDHDRPMDRPAVYRRISTAPAAPTPADNGDLGYLDIPAFLRRQAELEEPPSPSGPSPHAVKGPGRGLTPLALSDWLRQGSHRRWPKTYRGLLALGLDAGIIDWLKRLGADATPGGLDEGLIVTTFLYCLASEEVHGTLTRPGGAAGPFATLAQRLRRLLGGAGRTASPRVATDLAAEILAAMQGVASDRWPDLVAAEPQPVDAQAE
jgi:Ca-activated chloride channel family protein